MQKNHAKTLRGLKCLPRDLGKSQAWSRKVKHKIAKNSLFVIFWKLVGILFVFKNVHAYSTSYSEEE